MAQALINEQPRQEQAFLICTFRLGDALLGIDTQWVQEVIRPGALTVVHHSPEFILGVINLRGRIVTIIDLTRKLKLVHEPAPDDGGRIIIVDWRGEFVGLKVDRVADVIGAERGGIQPPPANVNGAQGRFFEGIYSGDGRLVAILNVEEILADEES